MLLYTFAMFLFYPTFDLKVLQLVCNSHNDTDSGCKSNAVSAEAAQWNLVLTLSQAIPAVLAAGLLGPLADSIGRRPVILVACVGVLMQSILCVCIDILDLGVVYLLIPQFICGMMGGFTIFSSAIFCATADVCRSEDRSWNFVLLEGMLFLGSTGGPLVFSPLVKLHIPENNFFGVTHYTAPFSCVMVLNTVVLFIAWAFIPESLNMVQENDGPVSQPCTPTLTPTWSGLTGSFGGADELPALLIGGSSGEALLPGNAGPYKSMIEENLIEAGKRRDSEAVTAPPEKLFQFSNILLALRVLVRSKLSVVLAVAFSIHYGCTVSFPQVWTLYAKHALQWSDSTVTNFFSMRSGVNVIGISVLAFVVRRCTQSRKHELTAIQFGLLGSAAANLLYVCVPRDPVWVVFLVTPLSGFGTIVAPCIKAVISKTVGWQEQGAAFSAISALETVMGLTAPVLFNGVYSTTVATVPEATFVTMAALLFLMSGGVFVLQVQNCFVRSADPEGHLPIPPPAPAAQGPAAG